MTKLAVAKYIWSFAQVKNAAVLCLGPKKRGKEVMSSRRENTHKISEQSLLLSIIPIRSRCYYYDVKCKYPALLHLSKNTDKRHN